jgi:hypothetical protein
LNVEQDDHGARMTVVKLQQEPTAAMAAPVEVPVKCEVADAGARVTLPVTHHILHGAAMVQVIGGLSIWVASRSNGISLEVQGTTFR